MTTSASTPRLRITQTWYLALLLLAAINVAAALPPAANTLAGALAMLLVGGSFIGRIWCSAYIAGRKDQTLVTTGPYARCRNPLYSLSWLGAAGLGLATRSLTLTLLTLLLLAVLFWRAAVAEEVLLSSLHGAAFERWKSRTPRFLPLGSGAVDAADAPPPPLVLQQPADIYWKAFRDAGSMLLLFVLIDALRQLREQGWLPSLLHLP